MRRDDGVAVVWGLALMTVILLSGLLAAGIGVQAAARQHADAVADLAAVAAAQAADRPCDRARDLAAANGLTVTACGWDGLDAVVEVRAESPPFVIRVMRLLGRDAPPVRASARAGPP